MRSLLACFVSLVLFAAASCSEEDPKPASDPSTEGGSPDGNRPANSQDGGPTQSCREECEARHGGGRQKDEAIITCWKDHCQAACLDQQSDAGTPPATGQCLVEPATPTTACDECTSAYCCAPWDECFLDEECATLNDCYQDCL